MLIHIVDDDLTILDAASFLLQQVGYQVKIWPDSEAFITQVDLFQPDVVLLDMKMPKLDGKQVHQYLLQQQSTLAVIIMTAHGDIPMAVQELKQGAVDFLQKPVQFAQLHSILQSAQQKAQINYDRYQIQHCYNQLSIKEREILYLLCQGYINRQIAESLNIAVRTVEVHRSHIMEKMQAQTIAELIYKTTQIESLLS